MMTHLQKAFPERREMLVDLLGVNLDWRMHQVSDGQRRRVQLFLQLLRPVEILLLDEVTTDLDVITRADFLAFLKSESEEKGVTIVYATHIFDGLAEVSRPAVASHRVVFWFSSCPALLTPGSHPACEPPSCPDLLPSLQWFTDVAYIEDGKMARNETRDECEDFQALLKTGDTAPLLRTIEKWLRADKDRKRAERLAGTATDVDSEAAKTTGNAIVDRTSMSAGLGNGFTAGRMAAYMSMTE